MTHNCVPDLDIYVLVAHLYQFILRERKQQHQIQMTVCESKLLSEYTPTYRDDFMIFYKHSNVHSPRYSLLLSFFYVYMNKYRGIKWK